jgi:hypothetical protein
MRQGRAVSGLRFLLKGAGYVRTNVPPVSPNRFDSCCWCDYSGFQLAAESLEQFSGSDNEYRLEFLDLVRLVADMRE